MTIETGQIYRHHKGEYVMALYCTEPAETAPSSWQESDAVKWLLPVDGIDVIHAGTSDRILLATKGDRVWAFITCIFTSNMSAQWIPHDPGVVYVGWERKFRFCPLEIWSAPTVEGRSRFELVQEIAA